ncbi:MAG TPA: transposase [Thermoleophilaceae bacterium]|nr:transposase [Thermoleophilaceae bacterium]
MPRPLREDSPGLFQHVYARGNRRQEIFRDERDYGLYLALLGGIARAKKWRLLAYCLMPNHVHLLIETAEGNLARGMQDLHGLYARIFNDRHGVPGHLFQGRYGSKVVRDDIQFSAVVRYIALNPIEADLCDAPEAWPWNSFSDVVGGAMPEWLDVERLFACLDAAGADPAESYRRLVSAGLPVPG